MYNAAPGVFFTGADMVLIILVIIVILVSIVINIIIVSIVSITKSIVLMTSPRCET